MGTIAIVISYTVITSYQFKGGGDILNLIFPSVTRDQGMCIIAAFVIVFTAAAGMASIAYLDLVIGALVTTIVIVAIPLLLARAGGWVQVKATLPATHFQVLGNLTLPQALNYLIPTMLLLVGNQGMYQKFFSARSERDAKFAVYGWIVGTLVLETLLVTMAVVGSSLFQTDHPREIIPITAFRGLPSIVGALLLGGIFAKVISTANNYLFSPSTNLIHDVYGRFINPQASETRKLVMSRLIVLLLGLFALLQATRFESILNAAVYAYTVYGAAVTPAVLAVFFWKRATTAGAIASIGLGAAITVALNLAGYELAIYPALGASVVSLIVVSLLTPAPPMQKWRPFFEA
jgi:SSS family solute:Na+ symporter/sodium/proline symporter